MIQIIAIEGRKSDDLEQRSHLLGVKEASDKISVPPR